MSDNQMKMADVFELPVEVRGNRLRKSVQDDGVCGYHIGSMEIFEWADAAAHAINNHDRLSAENDALRAEVERLRDWQDAANDWMTIALKRLDIILSIEQERDRLKAHIEAMKAAGLQLLDDYSIAIENVLDDWDEDEVEQAREASNQMRAVIESAPAQSRAVHDAAVIERAVDHCCVPDEDGELWCKADEMMHYANQLRQQAEGESK